MGETESTHTGGWLYGAAVQGIQGFIYQTNELKDIIGASELVEKICTLEFAEALGKNYSALAEDDSAIVLAAGNIKYNFKDEEVCKKVVRNFPMQIMQKAPGITISQAVVKWGGETYYKDFKSAVNELESRLRTQRNKPARSLSIGATGILRSRKTGLPAVEALNGEYLDAATLKKREVKDENDPEKKLGWVMLETLLKDNSDGTKHKMLRDLSDLKSESSWLAVIHIDGNGLGQVVQKIGSEPGTLKKFSQNLDKATKMAARCACERMKKELCATKVIPIRPIVLSGDDLTVICRADLALTFSRNFIEEFEYATGSSRAPKDMPISRSDVDAVNAREALSQIIQEKQVFSGGKNYLTACGGIAFIKNSYPFYYGYNLAETLCSLAKKDSKDRKPEGDDKYLPASCVMFHKVQSGFIENFAEIEAKELTPLAPYSFKFGPYYLSEQYNDRWTIQHLMDSCNLLMKDEEGQSEKTHLREWVNTLFYNKGLAAQNMKRWIKLAVNEELKGLLNEVKVSANEGITRTPAYDILSLCSVQTN
jgi:hypothetical protein